MRQLTQRAASRAPMAWRIRAARAAALLIALSVAASPITSQARYRQPDPIGLKGGLNRSGYVAGNTLSRSDPTGLLFPSLHNEISRTVAREAGWSEQAAIDLGARTALADFLPGSQDPANSHWHAMRHGSWTPEETQQKFWDYLTENIQACTYDGLARALHAAQDRAAWGHRKFAVWKKELTPDLAQHVARDAYPTDEEKASALANSREVMRRFLGNCMCP